MTVAEMSRIDRTIEIKAPPERVWHALTTAAELSAWFQVTIEGDIAPGNEVWMTTVHPDYAGQRFRVLFVEPRTTVTFTLEPTATGTRLSVAETGFDAISLARRAKVYGDNSQGWTEVLVWLERYAEAKKG
jgi:uncharacterized protein YndB with AHSA1/START domain